jgi:hypothetical protein
VALIQFTVLKRKGKWAVKSNDQERSFADQLEAMHAAIRLANECGKNGKSSVVLLQTAKNEFETIWTYGESPFPPSKADLPQLSEASQRRPDVHLKAAAAEKIKEAPLAGASLRFEP